MLIFFTGYISLDEFSDACNLINEHMPCPMTHEQLEEICKLMDLNKDGLVDLNEFLESFRMVDPESKGRKGSQPMSPDIVHDNLKPNTLDVEVVSQCDPILSPAIMKPLNLASKDSTEMIEGHKCNETSDGKHEDGTEKKEDNENVQVHISSNGDSVSSVNSSDTVKQIPVIYMNSLQMSPVLSSRRGSQI